MVELVIYEPTLKDDEFAGYRVEHDLEKFKATADVIVVNRMSDEMADVMNKVWLLTS